MLIEALGEPIGYLCGSAASPDGNHVAFGWEGEPADNLDIYVKLIDGGTPVQLTSDPALERAPVSSPDGRRIAFLRATSARKSAIVVVPFLAQGLNGA